MCGIGGIFAYHPEAERPSRRELASISNHMNARGPDGSGQWWSKDESLGLCHRRLSILDLSERASQPMTSVCGRFTVVFNGEIYNYPALRRQLEQQGKSLRTNSDTEVLLHLYETQGADFVHAIRGMYAIAIWDDQKRQLILARDPYGIKPLYVVDDGETLRFASQVKSLLAGGAVSKTLSPAGVVGFHIWGHVPEPFTIYETIRALPPGEFWIINNQGVVKRQSFFSIAAEFERGGLRPAEPAAIKELVKNAAAETVASHLLADVEVGVFLSAGVDSGAILGLMRDAGHQKVKAITLGFDEFDGTHSDETGSAKMVADYYGAEHIVRRVSQDEFQRELPRVLEDMDQPSIDGVNTWFVSKAASEIGLKVALSGVGGDEILAGYPSFQQIPKLVSLISFAQRVRGLSSVINYGLGISGEASRKPKLEGLFRYGGSYFGAYLLRRALHLPSELKSLMSEEFLKFGLEELGDLDPIASNSGFLPAPSIVAILESTKYMRNQLLRDADWASMAHGIELRTPLVDIEFLKALSNVTPRITATLGKVALGNAPSRPLPPSIIQRKKTGFGIPSGTWMNIGSNVQSPGISGRASRAWFETVREAFIDRRCI